MKGVAPLAQARKNNFLSLQLVVLLAAFGLICLISEAFEEALKNCDLGATSKTKQIRESINPGRLQNSFGSKSRTCEFNVRIVLRFVFIIAHETDDSYIVLAYF